MEIPLIFLDCIRVFVSHSRNLLAHSLYWVPKSSHEQYVVRVPFQPSLKSVLWSVPSLSGRRNYFRKVALSMCRSLRGGTLFRTLPGRSLHGGDAFFRGKTPKIAEKLRKSRQIAEFRPFPAIFAEKLGFS